MTNAEWTIKVDRDNHAPRTRPYLAHAKRGTETVWGRYAATKAEAESALRLRMTEGGY